ncbi:hypothetical protein FHL15_002466 [Xylaria flabelliformis]|uniref:Capsule polysaccharide biosynthesis protein n=1 Tax=Xylaria flabelliformis TaxID=2512241 RepID=A0A553I8Q5_9PEZI|nr:hypothetical protein FHL15_002466 [Xylaria flabelliformis]
MNRHAFQPATPGIVLIPEDVDTRPDAELVEALKNPAPVRHERNVWGFWNSGWDTMKPWTQRNVLGWIRRQGPSWDVRILDMVPGSAANVQEHANSAINFVPPQYLPECFKNNTMDGPTKGQHSSDLARLPLLYLYGGVWLDVGSLLFRRFDDIFWRDLEDPVSPFEMGMSLFQMRKYPGQALTGFIAARKGNPFIERWMKVSLELWKGRTNCFGLHEHPLIKPLGTMVPPDWQETDRPRNIDMGGSGESFDLGILTDYLAFNMAYERVRLLIDEDGWDGPAYYRTHVHFIDTFDEILKSHEMMLQDELFPLLSLPFEPDSSEPQQKKAAEYVGHVLANCSIGKHAQGHWQPGNRIPLAMSWGMPGNENADIKEGTWSEYMRWASLFCEQTRYRGQCLPSLKLGKEKDSIIKGALLKAD